MYTRKCNSQINSAIDISIKKLRKKIVHDHQVYLFVLYLYVSGSYFIVFFFSKQTTWIRGRSFRAETKLGLFYMLGFFGVQKKRKWCFFVFFFTKECKKIKTKLTIRERERGTCNRARISSQIWQKHTLDCVSVKSQHT